MSLWFNVERNSMFSIVISIVVYVICRDIYISLGIGAISFCLIVIGMRKRKIINPKSTEDKRLSSRLLMFYPLFHIISLFSSSFIEEEHQTWYYLLSSYFLILTIEQKSSKMLFMLILSRLIRSWNQTGNKWLNLVDIGDYLNRNENRVYLFVIHLISSIIFIYLLNKSRRYSLSYILPIIVLIYRWNLFYLTWLSSLTPLLYYGLLVLLIIMNRMPIENVLFSLLYILCRPHNCFVIIVHMIFYGYLNVNDARVAFLFSQSAFYHLVSSEIFLFLIHFIFLKGNSNSFVTIDISTGFVGIPIYIPILHGILIYFYTYGLSIIWLLKLSKEERRNYLIQLTLINSSFVFCVFIQRYHLFVWTVFAPKVFYLCAQTAFNFFLFL
jgi:ethanolaminephosphotransferase